jgi:hypothetical protein
MLLHGPGHHHLALVQLLAKHGVGEGEGGAWSTGTRLEHGEGEDNI